MDLSEAIRAYQAAAEYYGETQVEIAAASEHFQQATTAQQTAYGVLQTAQQELLKAARDVKLPDKAKSYYPPAGRPVKDSPQADSGAGRDYVDNEDTPPGYERE